MEYQQQILLINGGHDFVAGAAHPHSQIEGLLPRVFVEIDQTEAIAHPFLQSQHNCSVAQILWSLPPVFDQIHDALVYPADLPVGRADLAENVFFQACSKDLEQINIALTGRIF